MKKHIFFSVFLVLQTAACSLTLDVGLEPLPTGTEAHTPTSMASFTYTPTQPPTQTPTITPSPTATPLPGAVVIPVASLGTGIPWLPIDKTRWPTSMIIMINTQIPPFNNPLVRQAFAAAVDRNVIVEMAARFYEMDPSPATTFIPPQTLGRDLYGEVGINFDPARARDLLVQAGYADVSAFPTATLLVNSYGETAPGARYNMAVALADMWLTHLGVTVQVQVLKPPTFGERLRTDPPELFMVGWLPDPGNDPDFIRTILTTGAEYNYGHFSNSDFDALIERAAGSHDPGTRQALYIEAERILCEVEAGIIPLYNTFKNIP